MTTKIVSIRLSKKALDFLDELVEKGYAVDRSDAIRVSINRLAAEILKKW